MTGNIIDNSIRKPSGIVNINSASSLRATSVCSVCVPCSSCVREREREQVDLLAALRPIALIQAKSEFTWPNLAAVGAANVADQRPLLLAGWLAGLLGALLSPGRTMGASRQLYCLYLFTDVRSGMHSSGGDAPQSELDWSSADRNLT